LDKQVKLLEIRDRATFIAAMAIRVSGEDGWLMRRAGFGSPMVYLVALATERACYDPYNWGNRTMNAAHVYIEREWDHLHDGDVVDVEFVLGETTTPKTSEWLHEQIVDIADDPEGDPRRV
jgi:hypothetical protein